jgi:hypothetical protein
MLKQAIERSPEEMQLILTEVLELPKAKQEDLAKLLRKTSLAAVISSARMVADRLEFLSGLEAMLFDPDLKKHFKKGRNSTASSRKIHGSSVRNLR